MTTHQEFKSRLSTQHYASAFIGVLINKVQSSSHKTFNQLIDQINKEAELLLQQCMKDQSILGYRNPICLESIDYFFRKITTKALKKYGSSMEKFKLGLLEVFKEFVEIIGKSTGRIVTNSKQLFKPAVSVLTFSYSKAVVASLVNANKQFGDLMVYICESNPFKEGRQTYDELTASNVDCKLIFDNEVGNYINKVDMVVVGAQTVLENGAILSRVGTYNLALCASVRKKPVYVFAETYKFLRKFILREDDLPQVRTVVERDGYKIEADTIDLTPAEHINLICSDLGLFTTASISEGLIKLFQ